MKDIWKKQYEELTARRDKIDAKTAPLITKRDALWSKIHPIKAEIDGISTQVKEIQGGEEYHQLSQEIGQLAIKLGGKALSDAA